MECALASRPVEALAAEARGESWVGGGGVVQFWVIAPEPLPSCRRREGELPPDFSRLKWQGTAAPGAQAARAEGQG